MIVAIMQPYFFPYIGYFQLMHAADVFVFHDDVQYIKEGWVNRNRILIGNRVDWLTMPVKSASSHLPINQRQFAIEPGTVDKLKRRLAGAYSKSSAFNQVAQTIFNLFNFPDANVSSFNCNSLVALARKLGINCKFIKSGEIGSLTLKGQDKVIDLCHKCGADHYINPIGGVELYDPAAFANAGIALSFLRTAAPATSTEAGVEHLSVIHDLMNRSFDGYSQLLPQYALLQKEELRASP